MGNATKEELVGHVLSVVRILSLTVLMRCTAMAPKQPGQAETGAWLFCPDSCVKQPACLSTSWGPF